ncbi:unnamed protein product [Penicillium pancosmium]
MQRGKRPVKSARSAGSLNVEPDFHQELINDNRALISCFLVTDNFHVLSGSHNGQHSYVSSSLLTDTEYPDPYLEVAFQCAYHEQLPPPDTMDDEHDETHDRRQDDKGYRSLHRACVKFTSTDFAELRIVRLEARTNENIQLQELSFSDAIAQGNRAIAPKKLVDEFAFFKEPLNQGELFVLRIELEKDLDIKTSGMHTPKFFGEQNDRWLELCQHHLTSRSFNLVINAPPGTLQAKVSEMTNSWERMLKSPGPFYQFYGNHPEKPFVKSGSSTDNVPRQFRPTNFQAPAQTAFMHKHEYNALLAYGYIDEHEHSQEPYRKLAAHPVELKFVEIPNSKGREFMALVLETDIGSARLQPGDPFKINMITDDVAEDATTNAAENASGDPQSAAAESTSAAAENASGDPQSAAAESASTAAENTSGDPQSAIDEEREMEEWIEFLSNLPDDREEKAREIRDYRERKNLIRKVKAPAPAPAPADINLWIGKVGKDDSWIPDGYRNLYTIRPYHHDTNTWNHEFKVRALPWTTVADPDFKGKLQRHPGQLGLLVFDLSEKQKKQVLAANHEMFMKAGQMEELWKLLLMNRISELKRVDFYGTITEKMPDFSILKENMNNGQKAAFEGLRSMPAFATALHGPPGTGKTHWAAKVISPLVQEPNQETNERHQIYAIAATNEEADKLAGEIDFVLGKRVRRRDDQPVTVVRLLPWHVEHHLARKDLEKARQDRLPEEKSDVYDLIYALINPSDPTGMSKDEQQAEKTLLRYRNSTICSAQGDPRVKEPKLHLAQHMLRELDADSTRSVQVWSTLAVQLKQYEQHAAEFNEEQVQSMNEHIRNLRDAVLQRADVIVSTPFTAGQGFLRQLIKPSHIIVDESSQIPEPCLWPLLAFYTSGHNPKFQAMILMGDHYQLPPTVIASKENCHFGAQLGTSFFYRLIANDVALPALYQQQRMHIDIADAPKEIFYKSRLQTSYMTNHNTDDGARIMRSFNKSSLKIEKNMVLIDTPEGVQQQNSISSSFNEPNVQATMALVERILRHFQTNEVSHYILDAGSICILTFYSAQERLHRIAMAELDKKSPDLGANRVKIATVDKFQGQESPIVILDMVVVDSIGFLNVPGRMNSALTRAQNALYVISSYDETHKTLKDKPKRHTFMYALFNRWHEVQVLRKPSFIRAHLQTWAKNNKDSTLDAIAEEGLSDDGKTQWNQDTDDGKAQWNQDTASTYEDASSSSPSPENVDW